MPLIDTASEFAHNVASYGGRDGERWLLQLDRQVALLADRWELTAIRPFAGLSMNFVASASRRGLPVVLKVGWDSGAVRRERIWLEHYEQRTGGAVVKVLAHDEGDAYLMQRLEPGTSVDQTLSDDAATEVIGQAITKLNGAASEGIDVDYRRVVDWFTQLDHASGAARATLGARIDRANDLAHELSAGVTADLLHGDLHHMNVLAHDGRWLITDPQGVYGDPTHECAAMLRNALAPIRDDLKSGVHRRVAILAEITGFDAERIIAWGYAQNVLSCVWSLDSDPNADVADVVNVVDALA